MISKPIVCYLYTVFDEKKKLVDFVKFYKRFKSGLKHELVICFKLLTNNEINKLKNLLKDIKYTTFVDPGAKNDWDFGSYKRVAKTFYDQDILFLNSHSYPVCNNWLKKLFLYKTNKTVITPTASYESIVDSIKLKNKFHKIIRFIVRKYRFTKNFDKFPNPHIHTSSFLINSKIFYNYIKDKKLRNKEDTLRIESGKKSLTKYLKKKKIKIFVVNCDGKKFAEDKWMYSETYHFVKNDKTIISDKHTRKYVKLNKVERKKKRFIVWGNYI